MKWKHQSREASPEKYATLSFAFQLHHAVLLSSPSSWPSANDFRATLLLFMTAQGKVMFRAC